MRSSEKIISGKNFVEKSLRWPPLIFLGPPWPEILATPLVKMKLLELNSRRAFAIFNQFIVSLSAPCFNALRLNYIYWGGGGGGGGFQPPQLFS
jgi:hypothetical protein